MKVIDVIKTERECVWRASHDECVRDCVNCDLLLDAEDILEAYDKLIKILELGSSIDFKS